jgi:type IV secretion system protein VirB3
MNKHASMADPLFTSKTRPVMYGGVTVSFFAFNLFFMTIFLIASGSIVPLVLGFPLFHGIGYLFCLKDNRIFDILIVRIQKTLRCSMVNRQLWGGNSYDPAR